MELRPYQEDASKAGIKWMRRRIMPALIEVATGGGKSWIIAAVADWVRGFSGKRVLCLAPSRELVEQDYEKYLATEREAGIFCASSGRKDTGHLVTFGSPMSVLGAADEFTDQFAAVIVDEAHGITPTIRNIIERMRERNPNLRVLGLTATPYRTGTGYIYAYGPDGQYVGDDQAIAPYFNTLLYRITARELIEQGFLVPVVTSSGSSHYDAAGLKLNGKGQFDAGAVQKVFERHGDLTAKIVETIIKKTRHRKGVMLFASTIKHAKEILALLPRGESKMIGGTVNMQPTSRKKLVADFKAQRFKYLVNVRALTTGFDAPHVDAIAVLRATESPGLLQQIIGRGLRLSPETDKRDCLFMDFAENIKRHGLENDLFDPRIRPHGIKSAEEEVELIDATCPQCGYTNHFPARPNPTPLAVDSAGYFLSADDKRIETPYGMFAAHVGRQCHGQVPGERQGTFVRCDYRWLEKKCPACGHMNALSARACAGCGKELIDPEESLNAIFSEVSADPRLPRTEVITGWLPRSHTSHTGRVSLLISWDTEQADFNVWYSPRHTPSWQSLCGAVFGDEKAARGVDDFLARLDRAEMPRSITYKRDPGAPWVTVLSYEPAAGDATRLSAAA